MIISDNSWKPQIQYLRKLEYCEKVQYWRHLVPHSNQLINSKHLQRPLKENATVFPYSNMFFPQLRRVDMYLSRLSPCT